MTYRKNSYPLFAFALMVLVVVVGLTVGLSAPAEAASAFHTCKSLDVATFDNRVHVRCDVGVGPVIFFAAPTANSAHAARILAVLLVAHSSNRSVRIEYDPATDSGVAFGCLAKDCRRMWSVGVL